MSRPYTADGQGRYRVPLTSGRGVYVCGTKAQAGAYATRQRQQAARPLLADKPATAGDRICWNGTLDALARPSYRSIADRKPCACCGTKSKGRYVLSDYGRKLLERKRRVR